MFIPTLHLLFLVILDIVSAQSTSLPSATPGQNNDKHPDEERVSIASAALSLAVGSLRERDGILSISGGDFAPANTPVLYSQLAEFDIDTHNTTYKDLMRTQFPKAVSASASSTEVYDHLLYGYAASKAYVAYQDTSFLDIAQQVWNFGRTYCISEEDAKSTKIATKSSPLRSDCNGKSLVGGVFEITNSTSRFAELLDSTATGAFLILSALLAEQTSNDTYIQAVNQTLQFLRNFMYFPSSNGNSQELSILAFQDGSRSTSRGCDDNVQPIWYPVTGNIIEGLSVLVSITGDTTTQNLLHDTIISATLDREQQRPDHIIEMGSLEPNGFSTGDPFLVRGLAAAYKRNHTIGIGEDVKNFINIQYNALLNNATFPGTNVYGGSWIGPPQREFDPVFQTYASVVLVQSITLANSTTEASGKSGNTTSTPSMLPEPTTTTVAPSPKKKGVRTGAIVGGVVGGVAAVVILSGLICLLVRRRKRRRQVPPVSLPVGSPVGFPELRETDISPPLAASDPARRLSKWRFQAEDESPEAASPGEGLNAGTSPPQSEDPHARLRAVPTAELALVLNARLQNVSDWNDESLPSYPHSRVSSGNRTNGRDGSWYNP